MFNIVEWIINDRILLLSLWIMFIWCLIILVGLSNTNANNTVVTTKNTKQLSYFQEVKNNFKKDDVTRIKYVSYILKQNWYCNKNCNKIWVVANAIIRAEWGNKTIYGSSVYHNPFHIKYCMKRWYEMWLVKWQWKFCIFKNYKSAIIAWWRMWVNNKYNSNSLKTARIYTGWDKVYSWMRIVYYYKHKFSYLIK